jgi:peptidoglycan/LPS O-acetylase OafA/YrhL
MDTTDTLALIILVAVLTLPFLWARWWPHVKEETKKSLFKIAIIGIVAFNIIAFLFLGWKPQTQWEWLVLIGSFGVVVLLVKEMGGKQG